MRTNQIARLRRRLGRNVVVAVLAVLASGYLLGGVLPGAPLNGQPIGRVSDEAIDRVRSAIVQCATENIPGPKRDTCYVEATADSPVEALYRRFIACSDLDLRPGTLQQESCLRDGEALYLFFFHLGCKDRYTDILRRVMSNEWWRIWVSRLKSSGREDWWQVGRLSDPVGEFICERVLDVPLR